MHVGGPRDGMACERGCRGSNLGQVWPERPLSVPRVRMECLDVAREVGWGGR